MQKTVIASALAFLLVGCGSTSSDNTAVDQNTPPSLTEVSKAGYNAYDPALHPQSMNPLTKFPVPALAGDGKTWQLDTSISDDFDYAFAPHTEKTDFGTNEQWYNFYHNAWDGPGSTYWKHEQVEVKDGNLVFKTKRSARSDKQDKPGVNTGAISSNTQVSYPVFVEASVSMADISLASAVWLLTPDDTQEIDILEAYAGSGNGNDYFSKMIHLSHHSLVRDPWTDYQPRDENSWWKDPAKKYLGNHNSWGEHTWNDGDRQYVQIGVNWVSPFHFEYYINGELVRVVYHNAFATKINDLWAYTYPKVDSKGELIIDGYQSVNLSQQSSKSFNFASLKAASEQSEASVIDPGNYQYGKGFYKPADIIINMELQDWWASNPTDEELTEGSKTGKTSMLVDWIRVYKPVDNVGAKTTTDTK